MENVKPVRRHFDSHLSASSSSDSSLELSTHPKESLGDIYTKPEEDAFVSASSAALSFLDVSSQTPQRSVMTTSPCAETGNVLSPDAFPQNLEPTKSPPSHTMDHPPGYDPNRIPKSIFSNRPTTSEWSTQAQPRPQPQPEPEFQPAKQPQQKQSEPQPRVAEKSWCLWFSCWPRCC